MTDRLRFIKPAVQAHPHDVARALRKVATVLDWADDGRQSRFYTGELGDESVSNLAHAWAQTALIIADKADMDSVTLRAIATTIDKGEQNALPFS